MILITVIFSFRLMILLVSFRLQCVYRNSVKRCGQSLDDILRSKITLLFVHRLFDGITEPMSYRGFSKPLFEAFFKNVQAMIWPIFSFSEPEHMQLHKRWMQTNSNFFVCLYDHLWSREKRIHHTNMEISFKICALSQLQQKSNRSEMLSLCAPLFCVCVRHNVQHCNVHYYFVTNIFFTSLCFLLWMRFITWYFCRRKNTVCSK